VSRLNVPKGGTQPSACESVQRSLKEVLRRFQAADSDLSQEAFEEADDSFGRGNVPLLCPLQELAQGGAAEEEWRALKKRHEDVSRRLTAAKHTLTSALPVRATRLSALKSQKLKLQLRAHAGAIRAKAQESHVVILRDELRRMKQVDPSSLQTLLPSPLTTHLLRAGAPAAGLHLPARRSAEHQG